jgi:uncharacterized repeat protein (TIGR01451 family)
MLGGSATLTNSPEGDGALQLTSTTSFDSGYAIDNQSFKSTQGFSISFEFFSYGTTSYGPADGFSIFLVDADGTTPGNGFVLGGSGGSLGYAPRKTDSDNMPGVTKGYLGIGMDEYGNYGIASESKTGGYPGKTDLLPNAVSLRGPYNSTDATRATGYAYLAGSNTLPFDLAVGTSPTNSGSRVTDPTAAGYRKAFINVIPVISGGKTIYKITVRIQHGQSVTTAVNSVTVTDPPPNLRVGFAGSTGGSNSIHEIRSLAVVQAPIAVDDNASTAYNQPVKISVLNNDLGGGGADIDPTTVDLDPSTVSLDASYTVPDQGTFAVDKTGLVTFTPVGSFVGTASIPYMVQNQNMDTSNPGTISVVVMGAEVATVVSGPATINPGQTASFAVTTTNNGQELSEQVMPMLTLPAGFTLVSSSAGFDAHTSSSGVTTITFDPATLPVGESMTNTVQLQAASAMSVGSYTMSSDYMYPTNAFIPDAVASNNASTLAVAVVGPLPVQLTRFTAVAAGTDALLNWETAQEVNNQRFELERSLDGTTFTTIGTLAGHGTRALASTYRYLDAGAGTRAAGALYYRLRQVDADSKASFSSVQTVRFRHAEASVALYPNPTTGSATLDLHSLPAGDYTVQVFETTGRLVHQATYQPGQRPLPLEGLATGSYFVKVQGSSFTKVLPLSRQ